MPKVDLPKRWTEHNEDGGSLLKPKPRKHHSSNIRMYTTSGTNQYN